MPSLNFQPRFVRAVENGIAQVEGLPLPHPGVRPKRQTIRGIRRDRRTPSPDELLYLGTWEGRPYRSPLRRLGIVRCLAVGAITISDQFGIRLSSNEQVVGRLLTPEEAHLVAVADGFGNLREMIAWFGAVHGLPFEGFVRRW